MKSQHIIILKIGADCELFIKNNRGQAIPVIGKLGGTKLDPKPVLENIGKGYAVQEDNVMAEFNIPAHGEVTGFITSINRMLGHLSAHFLAYGAIDSPYHLDIVPSAVFSKQALDHPQAQEIGCEADVNVWTGKMNGSPKEHPMTAYLRTSGAHVHTSYVSVDLITGEQGYPTKEDVHQFVKMEDLFKGVPSILLDKDKRRRVLYGKAGAFRYKDYSPGFAGSEYRVLSNFWLTRDVLKAWVFQQTLLCAKKMREENIDFNKGGLGELVQRTINNGDEETALSLCSEFDIKCPQLKY